MLKRELLDDFQDAGTGLFRFSGLQPGNYTVVTYATPDRIAAYTDRAPEWLDIRPYIEVTDKIEIFIHKSFGSNVVHLEQNLFKNFFVI